MTTFAIGDIHGAAGMLDALLRKIDKRAPNSRLWFVGDLVNRGPDSAGVLRRVRDLGERAVVVLGNHDLSLLALATRPESGSSVNESLRDLMAAPDRDTLLDWLRQRPLLHRDTTLGWTMVHAGIPAEWPIDEAMARARELEAALRSPDHASFLTQLFGNTPERWNDALQGPERLRYIANALTRQRFVHADGRLDMQYKKTLAQAPKGLVPWFAVPDRGSADERIVFGHWSALERIEWPQYKAWGIDTGAAWSGPLTALELDSQPLRFLRTRKTR